MFLCQGFHINKVLRDPVIAIVMVNEALIYSDKVRLSYSNMGG